MSGTAPKTRTVDCCLKGNILFVYVPPERIHHRAVAAASHSHHQPWLLLELGIGLILYAVLAILLWLLLDETMVISVARTTMTTTTTVSLPQLFLETLRQIIFDRIPNGIATLLGLHISISLAYAAYLHLRRTDPSK